MKEEKIWSWGGQAEAGQRINETVVCNLSRRWRGQAGSSLHEIPAPMQRDCAKVTG